MKEFPPEQIEKTREFLISKPFPVEFVKVDGDLFNYFVLDPELNPAFPDFAFRMTGKDQRRNNATGIFGVSSDVPKDLRPFWMEYEIRAFWDADLTKESRLFDAQVKTLASVPDKLKYEYITRRKVFFRNAVGYFDAQMVKGDDSYTQFDIDEAEKVIDFLDKQELVPPGDFHGDGGMMPDQFAAMRRAKEFGEEIAREHPEVANLYRDVENGLSNFEIGKLFYEQFGENPDYFEHLRVAVGYAIRSLISREEMLVITRRRRAIILKKNMGEEDDVFRQHQKDAANARHALGIPVDVNAMIMGRGRTPWISEEKTEVLTMIDNPYYQIQTGQWKGKPNYDLIAEDLNYIFHEGNATRYANSVASLVRDSHRKNRK